MNRLRRFTTIATAVTCVFATAAMPSWRLAIAQTMRHGRSIQETSNTIPALSRIVRVGEHPGPIAVDSHTHRVFVVDQGRFSADYRVPIARGDVSVLDADSGRLLRNVAVGTGSSAIVVSERTGRVFVANSGAYDDNTESFPSGGTVSVLDAGTGKLLRSIRLSGGVSSMTLDTPTGLVLDAPARRVLAINPRGLYVLDDTSGALLRTIATASNENDVAVNARTGRVFLDTGEISGLDVLTGRVVTHTSLDLPAYAMSVDERANRVVVSVSGARGLTSGIRVLDAATGKLLHSVNPLDYPGATMTLDALTNRAFIVNYPNGYEEDLNTGFDALNVVDTRNGRVLASHGFSGVGNDYHLLTDERRSRVFVVVQRVDHANCCTALLGRGSVEILDAHNGRMLRQVRVGKGAEGITLDARTGRVFVANSDDGTVSVIDPQSTH